MYTNMYFYMFILCLNTITSITSMIKTNVFFDFTDFTDFLSFHRLLIIRLMRPDRLTSELTRFGESNIGAEYIRQPSFDIRKAIDESSPSTPIFFTLFPGVDPTRWVEEHAKNVANKEFLNISMGQGQEDRAENSVHEFSERGGWIFLQNIHLMQAWLPRLEHTLEQVRDVLIV